jgi:hypothetical protein
MLYQQKRTFPKSHSRSEIVKTINVLLQSSCVHQEFVTVTGDWDM